MKIILDNGHIMHYNNHCSAGVAHLVERDLAKVEVASSSLVARSKKKHHPTGWCFFAFAGRAEARTGHERSERNMPGACFGARVRVAVRQGSCEWLRHSWDAGSESSLVTFFAFAVCGDADNKSSGQSQRNTILQDGVSLHLPGRRRCAHRHAGSTKASYFYDAFVLLGRWSKGTLFNYLLYFFFFPTTVVPMAAPPLTSSRAIHKAEPLVSPVWGDLGSSFSFAVTVSAFLIPFVPSLSL